MHCNLRQPDAAQSLSTLILSPVSSLNSAYPLPLLNVFTAYTLHYAVTLNFDPVTLTFDLWPWAFVVCRLWRSQTLYEIWAKLDNPRWSYCSLNIWPYDCEHVSRAPLCCGIVCTKFKLSQAIRLWNVTIFFMLIRHVTLWRWALTRWPWKCRVVIVCSKFHWNRTTPADVFTIWPVDLELLWYFRRCVQTLYKIRAKSHNPRQSYWKFSTFSQSSSRDWSTFSGRFSGVRGPNFSKLGEYTGRTWPSYGLEGWTSRLVSVLRVWENGSLGLVSVLRVQRLGLVSVLRVWENGTSRYHLGLLT